ncbi:MAG: hypothetical protein LBV08_04525, partial [Clostridiales bacterium]|nr:hypothetical protein [Clostridiales bacterium]
FNINDGASIEGGISYTSQENNINMSGSANIKQDPEFKQMQLPEQTGPNYFSILGSLAAIVISWFIIKTFFPQFFDNSNILLKSKFLESLALGASSIILFIILVILGFLVDPPLAGAIISSYISLCLVSVYISLAVFSVNIARSFNSMNNLGYFIAICFVSLGYTLIKIFMPSSILILGLILGILGIGFTFSGLLFSRKNYIENMQKKPPVGLDNFN